MTEKARIGIFPDPFLRDKWSSELSPVLKHWAESIEAQGFRVQGVALQDMAVPSRLSGLGFDLLHCHWPESLLQYFIGSAFYENRKLFLKFLRIRKMIQKWFEDFKKLDIPLVLQIHDLVCHQYQGNYLKENLDVFLRKNLYANCAAVLTQEWSNVPYIEEFFGKKPIGVTYLGDFQSFHGPKKDKSAARFSLELPQDKRIFSYVGTARPNRNPSKIIDVFNQLESDDGFLIIAGIQNEKYKALSSKNNVKCFAGMLPNEIMRDILSASDFLVNDGKEYLTSGVMRCAMSYMVPVITYRYGAANDMVAGAAIYIDDDRGGLKTSIYEALYLDESRYLEMQLNARLRNQERTWSQCGEECRKVYSEVMEKP